MLQLTLIPKQWQIGKFITICLINYWMGIAIETPKKENNMQSYVLFTQPLKAMLGGKW